MAGTPFASTVPPPPAAATVVSRWEQWPPANRQRLLQLLGRLVEDQLTQQAHRSRIVGEEADHESDTDGE